MSSGKCQHAILGCMNAVRKQKMEVLTVRGVQTSASTRTGGQQGTRGAETQLSTSLRSLS